VRLSLSEEARLVERVRADLVDGLTGIVDVELDTRESRRLNALY
jgi:hypothetical protein